MISRTNALTFIKNNKYKIITIVVILLIIIIVVCCVLLIKPSPDNKTTLDNNSQSNSVTLPQETKDYIKNMSADNIYIKAINNSFIDMLTKDAQQTIEPFTNEDIVLTPYLIGNFYRIYKDLISKNVPKEIIKAFIIEYVNTHNIKLSTDDINSFGSKVKKLFEEYLKDIKNGDLNAYNKLIYSVNDLLFSYANIDYELLIKKINYEFNIVFPDVEILCKNLQQSMKDIFKNAESVNKLNYDNSVKSASGQYLMINKDKDFDPNNTLMTSLKNNIYALEHKYGHIFYDICERNGLMFDKMDPAPTNEEDIVWLVNNFKKFADGTYDRQNYIITYYAKYGYEFVNRLINKLANMYGITRL